MSSLYERQFKQIQKCLKIDRIISIRFSDTKTADFVKYNDTACTVVARSLKNNISTYIDRKIGQLCSGGNYFLNITHPAIGEIRDVYVKAEKVFKNNSVCDDFIKNLPEYPGVAKRRYVLFTPLIKERHKPDMIMLLANPAQAGRILGLGVHDEISQPLIVPALSTCASIYAPLVSGNIHINFIDYYDRYYQGKQHGRLLWNESDLIVSMPFCLFENIVRCIPLSPHGSYKPKIKPQKIDHIDLPKNDSADGQL